jgi:hypothetical protein
MTDAEPNDLALAIVAASLGKSPCWLQARLSESVPNPSAAQSGNG